MSKHTPGPWTVLPSEPDDEGFIIQPIQSRMTMALIGEVYGGNSRPEPTANGRLIAAAPDLLDALKDFFTAWSQGAFESSSKKAEFSRGIFMDAAKAAIAKAEGLSPENAEVSHAPTLAGRDGRKTE